MADLLIELYSEEIPAGMQAAAAEQLSRKIDEFLMGFGVTADSLTAHVAPQRVALLATGLPQNLPDRKEQRKGPRVDAPEKAIEGFLRANGLDTTDSLSVEENKKGAFYVLDIDEKGGALAVALSGFMPGLIEGFQWPKSMRWGRGSLRWVRPLRSILCLFDGDIVPFEIGGLTSGNVTYGHRFMTPEAIEITDAHDYVGALEKAHVLVDASVREAMIAEDAARLADSVDCVLAEDSALISETAGLVEWPVPLVGKIDDAFMDVPEEVLISVMRTHQKYFALRRKDGTLAPYFITISNMLTDDGGAAIIAGNERVLRARLSDGRFFWDQDRKDTLESRLPSLEKITFQAKLGTVADKSQRIAKLAESLAPALSADATAAKSAAALCKADLTSGMVYEFAELQGIMGGYYARNDGLGDDVAAAIRDHYKPLGPSDAIPASVEGMAVGLADKIDTLTGFWSIDKKPTGSKDPYALRRAALGVIRILLETETALSLSAVFAESFALHGAAAAPADDLLGFVADRLKVHLRGQGISHDVVNAVFALGSDDVVELAAKSAQLKAFLDSEDGGNLTAAYTRANGICAKAKHEGADVDVALLAVAEEKQLHEAITALADSATARYEQQLDALATLRAPVDAFFEAVMVNDDDEKIRHNRLALLQALIQNMRRAADFDLVE
ncbi:glycine--tRNA ligase subunit beta [Alphaproteobacteria bacterium]|nr:glycine--tRNA ligase subunit beta [Alphaproteobacteria bacterium]MDA8624394.1 glycine--tRNA ligase subunit beta [Alphaproteobacteria bacterium]MDA8624494.1 glycine--tRNA ligase subunit beta [Alphaproteobacteria bacterium]MDB2393648.1 glycine--tRNA ligase subunit beta [Alphaproteobacteria bacterium]MDB2477819.1 glycine--tRNA ligase subunit beta [Alphaproteobacteria bacterium]